MRKFFTLTLVFSCLHFFAGAQITKGSIFFGGSVGFSNDKTKTEVPQQANATQKNDHASWAFRPQFGKVVADNRVAGIFLNFGTDNYEQTNGTTTTENKNSNYGGGVFYRRYYPLSQRFYVFGDAGLGVNFGKQENINNDGTVRYTSFKNNSTDFNLGATPGLAFAATRKLYLEAVLNNLFTLAYGTSEGHAYDSRGIVIQNRETNGFSASVNANGFSSIYVGLRWILPGKK